MSTPPAPPAPPAPPDPPAPPTPPPTPPDPPEPGDADELARLRAVLDSERKQRQAAEAKLDKQSRDAMTEQERAIATAREEGKTEAAEQHARDLAAALFRAAAKGRITNPEAALAVLDLSKLVKDGAPDETAIGAVVDQLAAVPPAPGHVPPGPRQPAPNGQGDWMRERINQVR